MGQETVSDYYDKNIKRRIKAAFNDRHFFIINKMKELGLNRNSTVLEYGCGIGVITKLMAKKVTKGHILALDISSKSITYARQHIKNPNVTFVHSEASHFTNEEQFDFVTFFDVLEHIPESEFPKILSNSERMMHKESLMVIHLPTAEHLRYLHEHHADKLQPIDQAIPVDDFIALAAKNGLRLHSFGFSDIWEKHDYQWMVFSPAFQFTPGE